jgi:hypothetical protein
MYNGLMVLQMGLMGRYGWVQWGVMDEIMDEFNGALWMGSYDDIEGSIHDNISYHNVHSYW